MSPDELYDRAWKLVEPRFVKAREEVVSQYRQLAGTGRTSREMGEIIPAAFQGRVEKLVVARDVHVWGIYRPDRAAVEPREESAVGSEDLLDLAAIQTLLNGGSVYTIEPDALPDKASMIALFRY